MNAVKATSFYDIIFSAPGVNITDHNKPMSSGEWIGLLVSCRFIFLDNVVISKFIPCGNPVLPTEQYETNSSCMFSLTSDHEWHQFLSEEDVTSQMKLVLLVVNKEMYILSKTSVKLTILRSKNVILFLLYPA